MDGFEVLRLSELSEGSKAKDEVVRGVAEEKRCLTRSMR